MPLFSPPGSGGGGVPAATPSAKFLYTGGNISFSSATFIDILTASDLTIAAAVGDVIEVSFQGEVQGPGSTNVTAFDVVTMPGGVATNYLSSGTSTPQTLGIPGWYNQANVVNDPRAINGVFQYVVQSADLSGGNLVLRLRGEVRNGTSTLFGDGVANGRSWQFAVKNLKH